MHELHAKIGIDRAAYVAGLARTLERTTALLERKPDARRVILFGSYARGRRDLFTDLDLLVVMDSKEDFLARAVSLRREIGSPVDMDLLVYTPQEFERMRQRGFVRFAVETGKVLLAR